MAIIETPTSNDNVTIRDAATNSNSNPLFKETTIPTSDVAASDLATADVSVLDFNDIGTLTRTPIIRLPAENIADPTDVFKFNITQKSSINMNLDVGDGDVALLELFRDSNNNGVLDTNDQRVDVDIARSSRDAEINNRQSAGTYFAKVTRTAGSTDDTIFGTLKMSATTGSGNFGASNIIDNPFQLGDLSFDLTFNETINNNDTADTWAFSLGLFEGVNIRIDNLSADADIRLIQDFDGDKIVDDNELIASSTLGGTQVDSVSTTFSGNYLLQVVQGVPDANTTARLTFDHFVTDFA